jgi:hypothetical protein
MDNRKPNQLWLRKEKVPYPEHLCQTEVIDYLSSFHKKGELIENPHAIERF